MRREASADKVTMRIALGHGPVRIGLLIRCASTGLAALGLVAILEVGVLTVFGGSRFRTRSARLGYVRPGTYVWKVAVLIVGLLTLGRVLLAGLRAWVGWQVLPRSHGDLLTELDDRAIGSPTP